tara:strand:- start:3447 stop:4382 length:936 start_codon:yes stop_codon:yes gene_type:complete
MKCSSTLFLASALLFSCSAATFAQTTPIIDVQGEVETSPLEGQQVTVSGKVTEYFGDTFYLQDDYGAWNGLFIHGQDIVIPGNPPYWSGERQPEVGDVLTLIGTVAEVDGNTELLDVSLVEFVDFWNATPAGVWLTADAFQDEQYEGTRVRIDAATILTSPDANGFWTVTDGTAELTCWGVDTSDAGNDEDPDGPTPGDIYQIYGALHQRTDDYVLHVGDIDVLALSVERLSAVRAEVFPNPASDLITWNFPDSRLRNLRIVDARGRLIYEVKFHSSTFVWDAARLSRGTYAWTCSSPTEANHDRGHVVLN